MLRNRPALFLASALATFAACQPDTSSTVPERDPNFVIILCDDLGYGDLGAFGHPTIRTPELDRMAEEGQKWTSFYAGASVCTPSRAALMTGRLPIRSGMASSQRRVLFPDSCGGLPESEHTIAEILKETGYVNGCIGKWHLGHLPPFLPTRNGFDYYFGIPYSNDMDRTESSPKGRAAFLKPQIDYWHVPLMRNEEIFERPADQHTLTRRYTEEALLFIEQNKERPFFLYLAHSMPHIPLFVSQDFEGRSLRGLYGDVIEEIDWSVGRILARLRQDDLAGTTLVFFSSDNGPWLTQFEQGGSAGLLRGGKGETFEGGMREPTIFWWPGRIRPGVVADPGAAMDILPTFARLAGTEAPRDRIMDGFDLSPSLLDRAPSPRDTVFYYRGEEVYAIRKGPFKAHFRTRSGYGPDPLVDHDPPLLYNLEEDPSEQFNVAADNPGVIGGIIRTLEEHRSALEPVPNQLEGRLGQD